MRDPLPGWAVGLVRLSAPPDAWDPFLGDLAEEMSARREAHGRARTTVWLVGEVGWAAVHWLAYRLPRSGRARGAAAPFFGVLAAWAILQVANLDPVIALIRQLPIPARGLIAVGLNLGAVCVAGALTGRLAGRANLRVGLQLGLLVVAWPALGAMLGAWEWVSPIWIALLASCAVTSTLLSSRDRPAMR